MKANTSLRLGITYGLFYLAYMSLFPFQTIYLTELGYDKSAISVLTTCTALVNFLIQFPLGRLSAKTHSPRKLLVLLMIGAIPTGFLMYLFHGNLAAVILAVLPVTLLDFSLIGQLDSYTLALQVRDPSVRYSIMRSIGGLTGAAATMVLGSIYASRGTSLMFPLHGSLMALAVLAALLLPKSPPVQTPQQSGRSGALTAFLPLLLGGGLVFLGWRAILTYLPVLLVERGGSAAHQGLAMSLMSFSAMPVLMLYPVFRRKCSLRWLLCTGSAVMALRLALISLTRTPETLAVSQVLESFSYGLLQPAIMELMAQAVPDDLRPRVVAIWTGIQMALCTVAANLLVQLLCIRLSLAHSFYVFSALAVLGLIILTTVASRYSERRKSHA